MYADYRFSVSLSLSLPVRYSRRWSNVQPRQSRLIPLLGDKRSSQPNCEIGLAVHAAVTAFRRDVANACGKSQSYDELTGS